MRPLAFLLLPLACLHVDNPLFAQSSLGDLWRDPVLPRDSLFGSRCSPDSGRAVRATNIRLFRMPTAIPNDPLGLEDDTDLPPEDPTGPNKDSDLGEDGRLQVTLGTDNPFFDFRRPGDPGGVGFYRLYSQYQLLDSQTTCLGLNLQAFAPAGLEADGVEQGPTIVCPSVAWYCDLGEGSALHAFIGKNLRANWRLPDRVRRGGFQYGFAFQRPLPSLDSNACSNVYLFLEALGRYRFDSNLGPPMGPNVELLPGIHWQVTDNWWMSGGFLMPVGASRFENKLWQITCSWQI
jgi:hypothetical protein